MSEPKGNKNLVWINTPFSLTKLDKQYTLLQQNILMVASTYRQDKYSVASEKYHPVKLFYLDDHDKAIPQETAKY